MKTFTATLFSACISLSAAAQATENKISRVFDYRPAPGQFVNKLPEYEPGDTQEDMNRKAGECIKGDEKILISLGGFGGYVIFGFERPVANVPGVADFKVLGNAFWADANPNPDAPKRGGSCEPGIVYVMYDTNGNGLPDDEWYELAGSEYHKAETTLDYQITYFKPDENKVREPMPGYPFINDMTYIKWEDNQGVQYYMYRNTFHNQPYYPLWIDENELVFQGTRLANNYVDESGTGSYYVQYAYDWGYADNCPNNDECSELNIEWAVDKNGNPVHLPAIHFVKVYTGVNQYCGWLGETSTEIMGAEDLHPEIIYEPTDKNNVYQDKPSIRLLKNPVNDVLIIEATEQQTLSIFNTLGQSILSRQISEGINEINCSHLPKGLYIIASNYNTVKFFKQ